MFNPPFNPISEPINVSLVPVDQLTALFRSILQEELRTKEKEALQEKLCSPEETCKLFHPKISKPTLDAYVDKGYLIKYYLGGRTWFKYSEILGALKSIKRYQRHPLSISND